MLYILKLCGDVGWVEVERKFSSKPLEILRLLPVQSSYALLSLF